MSQILRRNVGTGNASSLPPLAGMEEIKMGLHEMTLNKIKTRLEIIPGDKLEEINDFVEFILITDHSIENSGIIEVIWK